MISSLNKVMTQKEAECFRILRHWQRIALRQRFMRILLPRPSFLRLLKKSNTATKVLIIFFAILVSPVMLLIWMLNILRAVVVFPFILAGSYIRPPGLRPPGERNIKGIHYQFARHIDLPPSLYIECVDDWVRILYGAEKLPKYSLKNYLDSEYILQRQVAYDEDASLLKLIKTQISNAREDLSQDLGHYGA